MNTKIDLNMEALEGRVKSLAHMVSEDVYKTVLAQLKALLKTAPVQITGFHPVNGNACVETINSRELAAVYALINYAAHKHNLRPETVQDRVKAAFRVDHIGLIPRDKFDNAVADLLEMHLRFEEGVD